jgi:hypothetical protein
VPSLNEAELLARGGVPAWSVVYYFIPIVQFYGLYLRFVALSRINAQFGYGTGMSVLGLLMSPVWASVLAWGKARTAPVLDERVAAMVPSSGTGPLAEDSDLPTFTTSAEPVAEEPAAPAPAAATGAEPAVIHNPWAPTSPLDAPTPTVAIPAAIVPPSPSAATVVPAVAAPPAAMPASAPPAPPVVSNLAAPPPAPAAAEPAPVSQFPAFAPAPDPVEVPAPERIEPVEIPAEPAPERIEPVEIPAPEPVEVPAPDPEPVAPPAPAETPPPAAPVEAEVEAEVEDDEDEYASTVVVDRRPNVRWALLLDDGRSFPLTAESVELGRKPEGSAPGVQYLPIPDTTRTLSKTHARLTVADGLWTVTDLNSTNGVLSVAGDVETLLPAGSSTPVPERFILGKVGMRVVFEEGATS